MQAVLLWRTALLLSLTGSVVAQTAAPETVVIQAEGARAAGAQLPVAADVLDAQQLQRGKPRIDLSESLGAVPGLVVQNRHNAAQDQQISVRGFGARATFGVRGLRFFVDDIPATLPDGQGQVSHVELGAAGRLEVLRGPYSVLYGNAAGGVVAVFTEEREGRQIGADLLGGADGLRRWGLKAIGSEGPLHYTLSAQRVQQDGERAHSAFTRAVQNARLRWRLGDGAQLTVVANALQLPEAQDPLGLTRAQFEADPTQADAAAWRFDTRKTVRQAQAGAKLDLPLGEADRLRLVVYGGDRDTFQMQAIPVTVQRGPTHAGGVIDLQRRYAGADLRWTHSGGSLAAPWRVSFGLSIDELREQRRGYENFAGDALGVPGQLRRDEHNRARNTDPYLQAEWEPSSRWLLMAGLRHSQVQIRSQDRYVTPGNGDDSGAVRYRATNPVLGITWHAHPGWSLYAAAGRGFESPTLTELSYRSTTGSETGLNTALKPARSRHAELGWRARLGEHARARLAVFDVHTRDELAVLANSGGRSVFHNVGRTQRQGVEAQLAARWPNGWGLQAAAAWLKAQYRDPFCSGPCNTGSVLAGHRLPGAPSRSGFADVSWRSASGLEAGLEVRHVGPVWVDDRNSDAAPAYTVANLRLSWEQTVGAWTLSALARVENLGDRRHSGSVIVNEGNRRFFEPAPGRRWMLGAGAALRW